jgi:hypothetical protein
MPTDALAIERAKRFKYRLEINGFPVAAIQSAKIGKAEVGESEHAGAGQNFPVYEAGMIKFQELVITGVVPLDGPGKTYWQKWLDKAQDPRTGNGMRKHEYAQDFSLYDLDPADNPIRAWEFHGGWIRGYDPGERNSLSDKDDIIEEATIRYDWREQRSF